ncbi:accessory gene regulator B family protein [Clostridioides sp. ES-S-0048-02]|uniref:accessory gene regulator ArgB-like protein n=1 Tax=Clostridioides sp. ES-S-0048-02 TaxID=2770777 RepID=UPI001D127E09|nr:accessory gene regulator B family protein [Clostridioides sp. ES-S-0048-02]
MFKKYAEKITTVLVNNELINTEEHHIYSYGFEVVIASSVNLVLALTLALIFHKFIHVLLFLICYCSIRQFSGGYHANNHRTCILIFLSVVLSSICILNYINTVKHMSVIIIFLVLNYLGVCFLSPLEHKNNSLNLDEKKMYGKMSKLLATIIVLVISTSFILKIKTDYALFCLSALFWINIMLLLGNIQIRRENNEQIFVKST